MNKKGRREKEKEKGEGGKERERERREKERKKKGEKREDLGLLFPFLSRAVFIFLVHSQPMSIGGSPAWLTGMAHVN